MATNDVVSASTLRAMHDTRAASPKAVAEELNKLWTLCARIEQRAYDRYLEHRAARAESTDDHRDYVDKVVKQVHHRIDGLETRVDAMRSTCDALFGSAGAVVPRGKVVPREVRAGSIIRAGEPVFVEAPELRRTHPPRQSFHASDLVGGPVDASADAVAQSLNAICDELEAIERRLTRKLDVLRPLLRSWPRLVFTFEPDLSEQLADDGFRD